jgi:hypothetical protein
MKICECMRVRPITLVLVLGVLMASLGAASQYADSSYYLSAIQRAKTTSDFDGRRELEACVQGWDKSTRLQAIKSLEDRGYFRSENYVFVEIGHAGFIAYQHVYIGEKDGKIYLSKYDDKKRVTTRIVSRDDYDALLSGIKSRSGNRAIEGRADKMFNEAPCYFVNINTKALNARFAVFGRADTYEDIDAAIYALRGIAGLVKAHLKSPIN